MILVGMFRLVTNHFANFVLPLVVCMIMHSSTLRAHKKYMEETISPM